MESTAPCFKFASKDGENLCKSILDKCMPYDTHDYQMDAITHILDGLDVLFVTATGSGKTDAFIRLMHVMRALSRDRHLHQRARSIPNDPAMLVICPTKALELDMEQKMRKAGLTAIAINEDTVDEARQKNDDIYRTVRGGITMILLSPEQLKSPNFEDLLNIPEFSARIVAVSVDEAHLLNSWGKTLRPAFSQIGWLRARLSTHPPLLATTATLEKGKPTETVCEYLGLHEGKFRFIRRSNLRPDIRLVFRTMRSGARSRHFPELDWLLDGDGAIVVFCRTISLGFRVAASLQYELRRRPDCKKRVRLYNSLNWSTYNAASLVFLNNDPTAQIIIATDTLSVGFDSPNIKTVVIFGDILDTDDYMQKIGRIRIPRTQSNVVTRQSAIAYLSSASISTAKALVGSGTKPVKVTNNRLKAATMTQSMARLIMASCKVDMLNQIYDNPTFDQACSCCTCVAPPPMSSHPPTTCSCSGCVPETELESQAQISESSSKSSSRKGLARLTKQEREIGRSALLSLRHSIWEAADIYHLPSDIILPDSTIIHILDHIRKVHVIEDIAQLSLGSYFEQKYYPQLLDTIKALQEDFRVLRADRRAAASKEKSRDDDVGSESDEADEDVIVTEDFLTQLDKVESDALALRAGDGSREVKFIWKINPRNITVNVETKKIDKK